MSKYAKFGMMIAISTKLADGIIESQRKEISEKKALIEELEGKQ